MPLLSLTNVSFTFSKPNLLENITLHFERGERVGLVGRNGAGKSTLMKLIAGELKADDGQITLASGAVLARLEQDVPEGDGRSAFEMAAAGFGDLASAVCNERKYANLLHAGQTLTAAEEATYHAANERLADRDEWTAVERLETLLTDMQLPPDVSFDSLSAGMKRRVVLAAAMIREPDLLLLDEPTNHLDIAAIEWLQNWLQRYGGTLIFVTHDRVFLQQLAGRIIEVDQGRVFDWTCDYQTFLERRDQLLAAEAVAQAQFDRKLAEEERWIRQGIKARRTRNEGRVRALKAMRAERAQRRQRLGTARMQLQEAERSGALVAQLEDVSHDFGGAPVIKKFSTTIFRGDRVGIIGPNGAGKSTLLRILLGQLTPKSGRVRTGTNLEVGYFDQLRQQLDENKSARENITDGTDFLIINDQKRHVMGFLQDFLFSPDRAQTLVRYLSGGERNRLLLARMMSRPANVLVLDEPTNDLDVETLELLEELLPSFSGTVLLVSHDRAFINNVVTSTIVFTGDGSLEEFDGGYDDWQRVSARRPAVVVPSSVPAADSSPLVTRESGPAATRRKLSWREQRELEELPDRIATLEARQKELHDTMSRPDFYRSGGTAIAEVAAELNQVAMDLAHAYDRWQTLDA